MAPMSARITREAAQWHALQREGNLSAGQQAQFMEWLLTSPVHLREYLATGRIAGELGEALRDMAIDLEALLAADRTRRDASNQSNVIALPLPASPAPASVRRRIPHARALGIALAASVACIALAVQWAWPRSTTYVAGHAAPRTLELADATVVHLNAESELSVRFDPFGRRLTLKRGQASFVVAKDPRPLQVYAGGLRVQDIGTVFDVSLRRTQARIDVVEGRVRVWSQARDATRPLAELSAGQRARIDYASRHADISTENAATMTAWWRQRIVFHDEPLGEVADQFNRLNLTQLQIEDATAAALRLTGNLRGNDLGALRAFLDSQPGLQTHAGSGVLRVRSRAH